MKIVRSTENKFCSNTGPDLSLIKRQENKKDNKMRIEERKKKKEKMMKRIDL